MNEATRVITRAELAINSAPEKLIGGTFGKLTLLRVEADHLIGYRSSYDVLYDAICSCGRSHFVKLSNLRHGTTSCGLCHSTTCVEHSHLRGCPRIYEAAFSAMWERCTRPRHHKYKWYGGRGIIVDLRWKCYHCFASDMGPKPAGYSLDRVDTTKGYGPDNCRWASAKEQNRNHGRNRWVLVDGERMLLVDAAAKLSSDRRNIMKLLKNSKLKGRPFSNHKGHKIALSV
jgi:hypothetical protein